MSSVGVSFLVLLLVTNIEECFSLSRCDTNNYCSNPNLVIPGQGSVSYDLSFSQITSDYSSYNPTLTSFKFSLKGGYHGSTNDLDIYLSHESGVEATICFICGAGNCGGDINVTFSDDGVAWSGANCPLHGGLGDQRLKGSVLLNSVFAGVNPFDSIWTLKIDDVANAAYSGNVESICFSEICFDYDEDVISKTVCNDSVNGVIPGQGTFIHDLVVSNNNIAYPNRNPLIVSLNLYLEGVHGSTNDLDIYLSHGGGSQATICFICGAGNCGGDINVTFSDDGVAWSGANCPLHGGLGDQRLKGSTLLNNVFSGLNPISTWTLQIDDVANTAYSGTINKMCLEFKYTIDADPFCLNGVPSPKSCCLSSCGTCGGSGCSQRPGGAAGCCNGKIGRSGKSCTEYEAPCIL